MATRIKLKNSTVLNKVPTTSDIEVGELAINANAGSPSAYIQDSNGDIVQIAGAGSISTPDATETVKGIAEIATTAEVTAGTDDTTIVTPAKLAAATPAAQDLQSVCDEGNTTTTTVESTNTNFGFKSDANLGNGGKAIWAKHLGSASTTRYLFYGENNVEEVASITTGGDATFAGDITTSGRMTSGGDAEMGVLGNIMFGDGGITVCVEDYNDAFRVKNTAAEGSDYNFCIGDGGNVYIGGNPVDTPISLDPNILLKASDGSIAAKGDLAINTDALFVDASAKKVGIGVASPDKTLHVRKDGDYALKVGGESGAAFYLELGQPGASDSPGINYTGTGASLRFLNNGTDVARFDSSDRLLVGTSSARSVNNITPNLQIEGNTSAKSSLTVTNTYSLAESPNIVLSKTRDGSIVQSNDVLGTIAFAGDDGSDLNTPAALITAEVDGTPDEDDMPGRLMFATTADDASSPTEAMRIDSSQSLLIGPSGAPATTITSAGNITTDGNITNGEYGIGTNSYGCKVSAGGVVQVQRPSSNASSNVFESYLGTSTTPAISFTAAGGITAAGTGTFGGQVQIGNDISTSSGVRIYSSGSIYNRYDTSDASSAVWKSFNGGFGDPNLRSAVYSDGSAYYAGSISADGSITAGGTVESTNTNFGFKLNAALGNGGKGIWIDHDGNASSSRYFFYGENTAGEAASITTGGDATFIGSVTAPNVAKAWVTFDGSSVTPGSNSPIDDSYGVTSVTYSGTGVYDVNFSTNMPNTNYCVLATMNINSANCRVIGYGQSSTKTVSKCMLTVELPGSGYGGNRSDSSSISAAFYSS